MAYIINKIKDNIRKYGFIVFVKRAYIKIKHIVMGKLNNSINSKRYSEQLTDILNNNKNKKVIVFYPFFDFNMPNFQRFQQLAIALGNQDDAIFFYCTPNNIYDNVYGFDKKNENLYLTNQYKLLIEYKIKNRAMFFVSTDTRSTLKDVKDAELRGDCVIYDYVDEIHSDIIGKFSKDIIDKHEYIMNNSNIIALVTADKLLQDVLNYRNENVLLVSNGVRVEDFIIDEDDKFKDEKFDKLTEFKKTKKITICYYGALAKWFDYELVKYIAEDKNIGIVLIGIDYDKTLASSGIDKYNNILYLGAVEYSKLKYYANNVDILTIPFVINEITNATSPVKLFEYMALKKPIITTDLAECRKYKSVKIAKDYEDFKDNIYNLSNLTQTEKYEYKNILFKEANDNSWEIKAQQIIDYLNKYYNMKAGK